MTAGDFTNGLPFYHLTVVPIELMDGARRGNSVSARE
jgi:hypothetical protein